MKQAFDSLSERVNWIISISKPPNMTRISEDNKLECWIRKRRSFFGALDVAGGECVSWDRQTFLIETFLSAVICESNFTVLLTSFVSFMSRTLDMCSERDKKGAGRILTTPSAQRPQGEWRSWETTIFTYLHNNLHPPSIPRTTLNLHLLGFFCRFRKCLRELKD